VSNTEISGVMTAKGRAQERLRIGIVLSSALHLLALAACVFLFRHSLTTQIVAAGEGPGGASGNAIEVGVVDAKYLSFAKLRAVSHLGEEPNEASNTLVETSRPKPAPEAEVLPSSRKQPPKPKEKTKEQVTATTRPTANQSEQLVSKQPLRGRAADTNVEVGRTFGSSTPAMSGGIGIGDSGGLGGASGVPGGSEYGRRIQMILSRNYNPPPIAEATATHYVIIQLRIARDGQILSLVGGRVSPNYIKQESHNKLITNAAERAIIASKDQLPPFPMGFLVGAQEAVAEIWFRYPK
jgi:hypothetical protein